MSQEIKGWKNPYMLYILLTLLLAGFLGFMAYLAIENGWLPTR